MKRHKMKWEQMERYVYAEGSISDFIAYSGLWVFEDTRVQCFEVFFSNPLQGVCFKIREKSPRNGSF